MGPSQDNHKHHHHQRPQQQSRLHLHQRGGGLSSSKPQPYWYSMLSSVCLIGTIYLLFLLISLQTSNSYNVRVQQQHDMFSANPWNLIVVAPTFYKSIDETRFLLALESCREAAKQNTRLVLVDASPNPQIRSMLESAGRPIVKVVQQTSKGKGAALKEAIQTAQNEIVSSSENDEKNIRTKATTTTVIAFQELEKVDMFRSSHWQHLLYHMYIHNADVTVPWRSDKLFKKTYPSEQYHAETFANMYLNSLANELQMTSIDWTMGPVAFTSNIAKYWLDYDSKLDSYDVQLVPIINAYLQGKAKLTSYVIDYQHSSEMKDMEEGSPVWSEKRLMQLNFHKDVIAKRLKEAANSGAV